MTSLSNSKSNTTGTRRPWLIAAIILVCLAAASLSGFCAGEFKPVKVSRAEPFHGSMISCWEYDINGDGEIDYLKKDSDGDGVIDVYFYDKDFNGSFEKVISKPLTAERAPRHLIVMPDSVPYFFMEELWREGYFRDFFPPSRMISTFPSDTNPAFTEIFGTARPPGIEDRYYNIKENRVEGGIRDHMKRRDRKTDRTFHAVFDYEQNPRYGALIYMTPYMVSDHDLEKMRRIFWRLYREKPTDEPILLYIGSFDAIGHREGRKGMRRQLLKLEEIMNEIIYKTEGNLRISLFSDHGNDMIRSERMIDLGRHLARNGFRLSDRLRREKDVVGPCLGLINEVNIYTGEGNKEPLTEALRTLEGVDFVLYEKEGEFIVADSLGRARIVKNGDRYKYDIMDSDPLELEGIIARMKREGSIDEYGFAEDRAWFEATKAHRYPDIIRRLAVAMTDHVINRPNMFLSLEDGYCYGTGLFLKMIDLKSTHGSAVDTSTNGMAMGTSGPLPDYIRCSDLMEALGEKKPGLPPSSGK